MSVRDAAIDVLVTLSVITAALSCLGVLVMRTALQRLHYLGPLAMVAPLLAGAAVAISRIGYSGAGVKALFIAAVVAGFAPVLSHQTGRMAEGRHDLR